MQLTNNIGLAIFVVFLIILLYWFYRWRKSLLRKGPSKPSPSRLPSDEGTKKEKKIKEKLFKFPHIFSKSPDRQRRLKLIRRKLRRKKEEKEHKDIFLEFALTPLKLAAKPIEKLEKVVKPCDKETPFQKLNRLHEEKLEKEKRIKEKIARKKEHKQTILKLKRIVKKK